jgi:hypothetical protein
MGKVNIARSLISFRLPDLVEGKVARVAYFQSLRCEQKFSTLEWVVVLSGLIRFHEVAQDGTPGAEIQARGVQPLQVEMVGANDTIVDMDNGGAILYMLSEGEDADQKMAEYTQNVCLQGDYFQFLSTQPIRIADLLSAFLSQMPSSKYL